MRKRVLVLLFVSLRFVSFGQQSYNPEVKIIPPSPNVADIGQFGLAKAGLSDGGFSTQIPLYTYRTKNLSLPIFLTYHTNGFKVDKIAGTTGMDWSLNFGGNIGRMVLGDADELKSWVNYPSDFPYTHGFGLLTLIDQATSGAVETVPDIFTISLNGASGRFLCINNKIIKLEQNSLDIKLLGVSVDDGFVVTDNEGIKYLFRKVETSKSSSSCSNHPYSGSTAYATGWLPTQIIHPYGDTINFIYKQVVFSYSTGINQTGIVSDISNATLNCQTASCPLYPEFKTCISTIQNTGWVINEIYSTSRGVVKFNYSSRTDVPGDSSLIEMDVYDATSDKFGNLTYNNTTPVKAISFGYIFPGSQSVYGNINPAIAISDRMYLSNVTEASILSGEGAATYYFKYNGIDSLPPRLSFAQDHFGFFNGKKNNQSLVPQPTDLHDENYLSYYGFGDRNPDWKYSSKGILSRIIYPTGGYDSISYEANTVYRTGFNCSNPDSYPSISVSGTSTLHNVDYFYSDSFSVNCPQFVSLHVNKATGGTSYPRGSYYSGACFVPYNSTTCTISVDQYLHPMSVGGDEGEIFNVYLPAGTYRLKLQEQGPGFGDASFSYHNSSDHTGNRDVPGVRVAKILTYDKVNPTPIQTCYHYTDSFTNRSSGINYLDNPIYLKPFTHIVACPSPNGGCEPMNCSYNAYSSDNFYNLYTYSNNNVYYRDVFEYNGVTGENGVTEHKFSVSMDENAIPINGTLYSGAPLSNYGILNGNEYDTRFYSHNAEGNNFVLKKEVIKNKKYDSRLWNDYTFYGFQADAGMGSCQALDTTLANINGLHAVKFVLMSRWGYVDTLTEINYEGTGTITNKYITAYDDTLHQQPTVITHIDSKGNSVIQKNYYPGDVFTISNVNATRAMDTLLKRHIYSPVLRNQTYNNGMLMEEDNHYYSNSLFSLSPVLLQNWQQIGTDNHLISQVDQIGSLGNILQVAKSAGPAVSYIWDYHNTLPVAEIFNAIQSDVAFTSFEADGKGNWTFSGAPVPDANAVTGIKSYDLSSGAVSKTGLNSLTVYLLSLWAKAAPVVTNATLVKTVSGIQDWSYYEYKTKAGITSVTVSGTVLVDELRLYPVTAQMKTFTYKPLVGISSQTDINNHTTYYEYDAYNRLLKIRDKDKNIVKLFNYKYKTYSNEKAQWIPTGLTRCKPCPANPSYIVNIHQHQEKDMGTGSSTYNTTTWVDDGPGGSCSVNAVWENTSLPVYCQKTASNNNTGKQVQQQVDLNPCSITYNQTREIVTGTNLTACPLTVCSGEGQKLINYDCETGTKVYTSSVRQGGKWLCTYHYEWSDGSISADYQQTSTINCILL